MFACEDDEPNVVIDLDSEVDLKQKLDSDVKQSNSSTENHDNSDANDNVEVTEGHKPYVCSPCGRTFKSRVNFVLHMNWHRYEVHHEGSAVQASIRHSLLNRPHT